ncbi:inter-alpha-trypsin inhibitor-like [Gasterosteus aculeatus]|uniref:BPTI/Kunitz inhibitor domain-containing protein n=1 Tax=Gasterosteus aculeatus aculeatus TaxID=481459 RepID=A0AAQ4R943_GASAC|nr:inter-alpha-trypsin inhibitor-like [Gasterosteus aculeatus aculeatus]
MKRLLFWEIVFAAVYISHSNPPDVCWLQPEEGEGSSFIFAFFYNPIKDQCNPFIYKGQAGNGNHFLSERECIRNCSANREMIYPVDATKACRFKMAQGKCSATFLRYYYDAVHDKCKKFLWSGCVGNGNRFFDQLSCNNTCSGIHDDGVEEEEEEPDTPIAIICGVLLGIILVAILITVIVLAVQSKKKNPKTKAQGKSKESQSGTPLQESEIEMA